MNTTTSLASADAGQTYDVIVLGSGAAGFAAAVTASCRGLKVLLVEKTEAFGGTSAISGVRCGCTIPIRPGPPGITWPPSRCATT